MECHGEEGDAFLGTVLVTGGCGFIGSFITEAFAADFSCSRVVVASRNPTQNRIPDADYRACDFTNPEQVNSLLDEVRPRVIVHTVSPGPFAIASEHYRVTYLGTKNVLEIAKDHPSVRAFVWTSSANAVLLNAKLNDRSIDEEEAEVNDWKSSASAYSRAKGVTESLVLHSDTDIKTVSFAEDADWRGKLLTTCLRISALYGPRDKTTIPEILACTNTFASRVQVGPNKLVISWCYVTSAANAHVDAAKALLDGRHLRPEMRADGEAFFICDPTPMKFWDFPRLLMKEAGDDFSNRPKEKQHPILIPFWFMMTVARITELVYWICTFGKKRPRMTSDHFEVMSRGYWFSIEKAKKRLGYRPVCDTEEGLRRSVEWFRENGKL